MRSKFEKIDPEMDRPRDLEMTPDKFSARSDIRLRICFDKFAVNNDGSVTRLGYFLTISAT